MLNKIIFYLQFAKSKLNRKCEIHENARREINNIIEKLKEKATNE